MIYRIRYLSTPFKVIQRFQSAVHERRFVSSVSNYAESPAKLTQSYYHHASSVPYRYRTVGQQLDHLTLIQPTFECYVFQGENKRYTLKTLKDEIDSIAVSLLELGFEKNDRLAVWLPNTSENVSMTYACSKLGVIKVNINPAYQDRELSYCLNKVGCKGLVMQPKVKSIDSLNILKRIIPELEHQSGDLNSKLIPSLKHVIITGDSTPVSGTHSYNYLLNRGANKRQNELFERQNFLDPDTPLAIYFTSGTTGSPKAAILTNFNMANNGRVFKLLYSDYFEKLCCPIPLFHVFGEVCGTLNSITNGFSTIFPSMLPDTVATMKAIEQERCTCLIGAPIIFQNILTHVDRKKYDMSSLLFGIVGAAPVSLQLLETIEREIPIKYISQGYGMTENAAALTMSVFANEDKQRRHGSVGKAMPRLEVKLVNKNGETVPIGEVGEIWARGYNVMKGYWNDPDKTRETITNENWLKTGDVATMDDEGYLYFHSRQKEMVIIGGLNVYPVEIEHTLVEHPQIADAQVFGIPDVKYGEVLCAWIKLKEHEHGDIQEIKDFLSKRLAFYKIPKHIKIVESFIEYMTPTGKVQKSKLIEIAKELNKI
ncbi:unnamed protein product [Didymodactylos carnosus]|uniref:Medium-chain acyl-CoA ligase ACSF2, mitochondrial n=1 Tax=Didymodactylos carnosus TaxID=1234261 RepID=A0A815U2D6_9BILA|nr:unnamed protein product [Didymodactylos carnosus]CAF1514973.1 unnamed protein product [Didymodactylos carnosus]CAF4007645.1 unnamed protein product [Didymodactylos carnosus]CAF4375065.1 unnamed protein product [Didymodactylos carnosus]